MDLSSIKFKNRQNFDIFCRYKFLVFTTSPAIICMYTIFDKADFVLKIQRGNYMKKKYKAANNLVVLKSTKKISINEFYEVLYETLLKNNIIKNQEDFLFYGFVHQREIRCILDELGFERCR